MSYNKYYDEEEQSNAIDHPIKSKILEQTNQTSIGSQSQWLNSYQILQQKFNQIKQQQDNLNNNIELYSLFINQKFIKKTIQWNTITLSQNDMKSIQNEKNDQKSQIKMELEQICKEKETKLKFIQNTFSQQTDDINQFSNDVKQFDQVQVDNLHEHFIQEKNRAASNLSKMLGVLQTNLQNCIQKLERYENLINEKLQQENQLHQKIIQNQKKQLIDQNVPAEIEQNLQTQQKLEQKDEKKNKLREKAIYDQYKEKIDDQYERTGKLIELQRKIQEIQNKQSEEINNQGQVIGKVKENIEETKYNVENANEQLEKVLINQKDKNKLTSWILLVLFLLFALLFFSLFGNPFGSIPQKPQAVDSSLLTLPSQNSLRQEIDEFKLKVSKKQYLSRLQQSEFYQFGNQLIFDNF